MREPIFYKVEIQFKSYKLCTIRTPPPERLGRRLPISVCGLRTYKIIAVYVINECRQQVGIRILQQFHVCRIGHNQQHATA